MGKRVYVLTRTLHLYLGLFLSPFVLVFALSVFYLVHASAAARTGDETHPRIVSDVPLPADLDRLSGREQVNSLRPVLDYLGVHGDINFIRRMSKEHRLVVPVVLPGRETTVDLDLGNRVATISERTTGTADALIHLHKMPGPHNANIRGNAAYMRAWRVLADVSTYGLIFLTLSGVYLWAVLKAERRIGLALLSFGAVSFLGIVYAVCR